MLHEDIYVKKMEKKSVVIARLIGLISSLSKKEIVVAIKIAQAHFLFEKGALPLEELR